MARRPLNKDGGIATQAPVINTAKFKQAALYKVSSKGAIINQNDEGIFLINPDSIEDVKSSNWVAHNVPGQSDPILQWIHSGPRTVSFEALVTKDTRYYTKPAANPLGALEGQALSAVGSIASAFAGVNIPLGSLLGAFNPDEVQPTIKLDISRNLDYYRSLLYPVYNDNFTQLQSSPPLLVLYFNTSLGIQFTSGSSGTVDPFADLWVLTELNIKISKQNPDLTPLEAMVGFKLMQYTIVSRDGSNFGFQ